MKIKCDLCGEYARIRRADRFSTPIPSVHGRDIDIDNGDIVIAHECNPKQKDHAKAGYIRSSYPPCEICTGSHPTYWCCEKCNYGNHYCPSCGEELGHSERGICEPS